MLYLITLVLAASLLVVLVRARRHRHALRSLREAIEQKRPRLQDESPGLGGADWEQLCQATNTLIEETSRLQQLRSSQLAQLEATLGSLQEAVLVVDANHRILLANKALGSIFPRVVHILHQRLEQVLPSAAFLGYVDSVRAATASPRQEIEFVTPGGPVWVEVTGTAIPALDGSSEPWALFVLHDITKQKRLEAIRKEFVANVSHELRTPLSVIKGYVETLTEAHEEMPIEERERFLRIVQKHTDRLHHLLDDLLTLSRLESSQPGLQREPVALAELMAGLVEDYRARPAAAGHTLHLDVDAAIGSVQIDPLKIAQALENLIDNALKYTPPGSRLDLSAARRDGEIEVRLRDNGPGIPAEDLPHIFERFYRVDKGRSREKGGTGLGLSIVKHIVQLHGGRVSVDSRVGQGSTFFFSLPLKKNEVRSEK